MVAWDIDPAGVSGVVNKTKDVAEDFEDQLTAIGTALTGGANNSGSGIIQQAISDYADTSAPDIKFIVHRTGQTLTAAVAATNAYIDGDLQMAAEAQRSATAAPPVDDMPAEPGSRQR
jgi:hypothetical protein